MAAAAETANALFLKSGPYLENGVERTSTRVATPCSRRIRSISWKGALPWPTVNILGLIGGFMGNASSGYSQDTRHSGLRGQEGGRLFFLPGRAHILERTPVAQSARPGREVVALDGPVDRSPQGP